MTTKEKILKLFETSQRRIFFRRRYCPKTMLQQTVRIATMAAVAMCESIEAVSDEKAEIKWVNDIFVRDK